jgi:hypothetical protein
LIKAFDESEWHVPLEAEVSALPSKSFGVKRR